MHRIILFLALCFIPLTGYGQVRDSEPAPDIAKPTPAKAKKRFRDAKSNFAFGRYAKTIETLSPAVEPEVLLADPAELVQAYKLLGLSHFFTGDKAQAQLYFERLIRFRPDSTLDAIQTPPIAVAFFQDLQERLAKEIALKKEVLRQEREAAEERRRRENEKHFRRDVQIRSRLVAALPFGIGQFQNQEPILGAAFLGTEIAALSMSLASFLAVENLRGADGRFRNTDVDQARSFQRLQLVSGGAAIALMAAGIIQAMIQYQPTRLIRELEVPKPEAEASVAPTGFMIRF